jgi:hypothetical protein
VLLAVAAAAAMSTVFAHEGPVKIVTVNEAHEVRASALTLPATESGVAVFAPCRECPAKSYPASAATQYFLQRTPVTLADFRSAVLGQPGLALTVKVSVESGALVSVAALVPPSAGRRRTP